MKKYTEDQIEKIGNAIAEILELRRAMPQDGQPRYHTGWGTKTATGVYHSFMRIAEHIRRGELGEIGVYPESERKMDEATEYLKDQVGC